MMRGTHYLKSWSSTQKNVTLSSAEAELLAAVKANGEALGMLAVDVASRSPHDGVHHGGLFCSTGSSARKGNGTLRHVRVGHLWVQQVAADVGLKYHKVNGEENPSDACTKHLTGERRRKLVARAGQCQRSGRAQESLRVQPARTAPTDSPGCLKHQGEGECQHISTPSRGLSLGCDPVAVYCAKTLARLLLSNPVYPLLPFNSLHTTLYSLPLRFPLTVPVSVPVSLPLPLPPPSTVPLPLPLPVPVSVFIPLPRLPIYPFTPFTPFTPSPSLLPSAVPRPLPLPHPLYLPLHLHPFTLSHYHPFTLSPFHPATLSLFYPLPFYPCHPCVTCVTLV